MNITKEQIDGLNAVLKVEVESGDYMPQVEEALRKARKNVQMKGFRQGMVPVSVVKKMYGNSILFDELNKVVSQKLNEHIREAQLEILGQPLPKADADLRLDISSPQDLTLEYEVGLKPEFDLSIVGPETKVARYRIQLDDELLDKEIDSLRQRHGEQVFPEDAVVQEDDVLHVKIEELEGDQIKEGGVTNSAPLGLQIFKEEERKQFLGMKPGDSIDIDLFASADRERESVQKFVLDLKEGAPEGMGDTFRITLEKIGRMEKCEMDQEFFDKVFGPGKVTDEADFREQLTADLNEYFDQQAEIRFKNDLTNLLLDEVKMEFPDAFLKRWIKATNEKPITDLEVDEDYDNFVKGLRWSLITNRLGEENDIKAEREEIEALSKEQLKKQLEMYNAGGMALSDTDLDSFNASMMAREDHVKKTYEAVMEQKLFNFLGQAVTIEDKDVTLDEFRNLN